MTNMTLFTFPSTDGVTELHARLWSAADSAPRAVVQLVHGVSEHINRYDRFARFLTEHGFAVAGHDHLGHGDHTHTHEHYHGESAHTHEHTHIHTHTHVHSGNSEEHLHEHELSEHNHPHTKLS